MTDNNTDNNNNITNNKNVINKNNNSLHKNIVFTLSSLSPSSSPTITSHLPCNNICIDLSSDDGEGANNKKNVSHHDNVNRDDDKATLQTPVRPAIISVDRSGAT